VTGAELPALGATPTSAPWSGGSQTWSTPPADGAVFVGTGFVGTAFVGTAFDGTVPPVVSWRLSPAPYVTQVGELSAASRGRVAGSPPAAMPPPTPARSLAAIDGEICRGFGAPG
jgi:hypothetical protein